MLPVKNMGEKDKTPDQPCQTSYCKELKNSSRQVSVSDQSELKLTSSWCNIECWMLFWFKVCRLEQMVCCEASSGVVWGFVMTIHYYWEPLPYTTIQRILNFEFTIIVLCMHSFPNMAHSGICVSVIAQMVQHVWRAEWEGLFILHGWKHKAQILWWTTVFFFENH